VKRLRYVLIGTVFLVATLLGAACAAIIISILVQIVRGDELGPLGKDVVAIPAVAMLAFLLLKAARDLWQRLRSNS